MQELQIGDIVSLKSSPDVSMTVVLPVRMGTCTCTWFNKNNELQRGTFSPKTLIWENNEFLTDEDGDVILSENGEPISPE